ncbi:MAG: BON domain-containing protein [Bacteroidetes bacterium]|nr:BON domain-containing protein [Bacteroidota bacterium]
MNKLKDNKDAQLKSSAAKALKWHNSVRKNKIRIKIIDRWLTLEGEVDWEFQKNAARSMVENIAHINGITNNIKVTPIRQTYLLHPVI